MEVACNQKIIIVDKSPADKNHKYSTINLEAWKNAMSKLNNTTYKLWDYIMFNQNKYKFALSAVDFCNLSGACRSTYKNAVRELIEKGFLVLTNEARNEYTFYDYPNQDTIPTTEDDINISIANDNCVSAEGFVF